MELPVRITANQTSVACERGKEAQCAFDVVNTSEETALRVGLDTVEQPEAPRFTAVLDPVEIKLPPKALEKVVVRVRVPSDAPAEVGKRTFSLRAYDAHDPQRSTESVLIAVTVPDDVGVVTERRETTQGDTREIKKKKWKLVAAIAGGAVVLTAVLAVVFWPRGEIVPSVIGLNVPTAEKRLIEAGFKRGELTLVATGESPGGTVTAQSPDGESRASAETPVNLTVEKQLVTVPNLAGLAMDDAVARLTDVGLTQGETTTNVVAGVTPLTVLDQQPKAAEKAEAGSKVDLVVQDKTITVPSVVGLPSDQAMAKLLTAGLKIASVRRVFSRDGALGTVSNQQPNAGEQVRPGTDAHLSVRGRRPFILDAFSGAAAVRQRADAPQQ